MSSQKKMTAGAFFTPIGDFGKTSQSPVDYSRFEKWYTALTYRGHYEERMLNEISEQLDSKQSTRFASMDSVRETITQSARSVGDMWPYKTNNNYLSHLNDKELTNIKFTGTTTENANTLKNLQNKWDGKASSNELSSKRIQTVKLKV
jgi:hypothetical protein